MTVGPPIASPSMFAVWRRPSADDFLVEDRLLDQRGAASAVLGRPRHAGPPRRVQLALPLPAELERGLIAGGLAPGMVRLEPSPQLIPECKLTRRQGQVHRD